MDWKEWGIGKIVDLIWEFFVGKKQSTLSNKTGKKIIDVIKNEKGEDTILVKSPKCDFNSNSVLFVMPGEEAIFINNGKIVGKFNEGRYRLNTSNYPFLSDLITLISGERVFASNIYFVRKSVSCPVDWGTSLQVRDPVQRISTRVMCRGVYRIQISNSESFLKYYIGNGTETINQFEFAQLLKDEILQTIKSKLISYIFESDEEIIGIGRKQTALAEEIRKDIEDVYKEYGFKIVSFHISGMEVLSDNRREKIEDAYSQKRVNEIN